MRLPIKICGITNPEDAQAAIAAGAAALGFNLFLRSKRCIDLNQDAEWIARLSPFILRYAVVVDAALHDLEHLTAMNLFDGIQLHGDEPPELLRHAADKFPHVIKALRLSSGSAAEAAAFVGAGVRSLLLDADVPGEYGGTGQTPDLELAGQFVRSHPGIHVILSGGLRPDNVRHAIDQVRPHAVDVASGVELEGNPRRKDPERLRAFAAAVNGPD